MSLFSWIRKIFFKADTNLEARIKESYKRLFKIDPDGKIITAENALQTILQEVEALHWLKNSISPMGIKEICHALSESQEQNLKLQGALVAMRERKNKAYFERNQVVSFLSKIYPSGVAQTSIPGWSDDWNGCVYIDSPVGQLSWHFHDSQKDLFTHLKPYDKTWDGHTTDEKYQRMLSMPPYKPVFPPEGCKLMACWDGGWTLEVTDPKTDECVGLLEWPSSWPDSVGHQFLEKAGFEVC